MSEILFGGKVVNQWIQQQTLNRMQWLLKLLLVIDLGMELDVEWVQLRLAHSLALDLEMDTEPDQ